MFSYMQPVAALQAHGITAPKGGVVFIPGALGGHFWSSDHLQGFCRLDPVPGSTLLANNPAACDPGFTVGSPGQATYDPRVNADGTHNVYVPDNATRSPGVWRLTFDPASETVSNPVGMARTAPRCSSATWWMADSGGSTTSAVTPARRPSTSSRTRRPRRPVCPGVASTAPCR
jgi:hypothetical protein